LITSSIVIPNRPAKKSTSLGEKPWMDRMVAFDVAQQVEIPSNGCSKVVPALHEDLHAADRFQLVDFATDFFVRQ
jgi:hypothetical protein